MRKTTGCYTLNQLQTLCSEEPRRQPQPDSIPRCLRRGCLFKRNFKTKSAFLVGNEGRGKLFTPDFLCESIHTEEERENTPKEILVFEAKYRGRGALAKSEIHKAHGKYSDSVFYEPGSQTPHKVNDVKVIVPFTVPNADKDKYISSHHFFASFAVLKNRDDLYKRFTELREKRQEYSRRLKELR